MKRGPKKGSGLSYKGVYDVYLKQIKAKALERDIPFNITLETLGDLWEKQPICPYTGISLTQKTTGPDRCYTASLDRKNPDKGYQPKNIQWVYKPINKMKSDMPDEEFRKIIEIIEQNGIKKLHSKVKE
jgi:hypothetical protein